MNLVIQEYYLFMMRSSDMENYILVAGVGLTIVVALLFILTIGDE